ncbi:MAG TPA: hypothetical protein VIL00_04155 [Pseudonocardiaceae bacterium]
MSELRVQPEELHSYAGYLDQVAGQFDTIRQFVREKACDKSGFTGVLTLLQPAVDLVGGLFEHTLDFGQQRMQATAEGVRKDAQNFEQIEQANAALLQQLVSVLSEVPVGAVTR